MPVPGASWHPALGSCPEPTDSQKPRPGEAPSPCSRVQRAAKASLMRLVTSAGRPCCPLLPWSRPEFQSPKGRHGDSSSRTAGTLGTHPWFLRNEPHVLTLMSRLLVPSGGWRHTLAQVPVALGPRAPLRAPGKLRASSRQVKSAETHLAGCSGGRAQGRVVTPTSARHMPPLRICTTCLYHQWLIFIKT